MNYSQSLEQLENEVWGEPKFSSSLVVKCHELRKIPIGELSVEDLRLLIGQNIGLPHIVPLAIECLLDNPLNGGYMGSGALLRAVLGVDAAFWRENPMLYVELQAVMAEFGRVSRELLEKWSAVAMEIED
ncbi:MAG: contact-dependent growth inhibition system immunity protein [Turicibacter sp.]|nr:contact-dependent growth inhibition system immunity protein [Turicibacter sp.]